MTSKLLRLIVAFAILGFLGGCASVPQESAQLSSDLGTMIRDARDSHLALIDEYMKVRRDRVDDFMQNKWIPTFMTNFAKTANFAQQYDAANGPDEKAKLTQDFQAAAAKKIAQQRATMLNALDDVDKALRSKITAHYDQMQVVNEALTAHLLSAAKVTAARDAILNKLNVPTNELIPLQKLDPALQKIEQFEGKAADIQQLVDQAKGVVTQGGGNAQ
jgi:hypothetical protein